MNILAQLETAVGPAGLVTDPDLIPAYVADLRGGFRGEAAAVIRPASTAEVAAAVRLCHQAGVAIVPQGGNTGLCGGAQPDGSGRQVVLSLTRMREVRKLDEVNHTITVEAGAVLADVQAAAAQAGLLFPLSLGAEGSCTIGGNLSTNAGGTAVLRYGTMRDLTLGLEVVLPDGQVWDGLRALRKDNTGYDLKHLFVGAEGTLGVITAAVLRLFPGIRGRSTGWVGLHSPAAALDLITVVRARAGARLTGFELMNAESVSLVTGKPAANPWYVLVELTDAQPDVDLDDVLANALAEAEVEDAVIAGSQAQATALWAQREAVPEAQNREGTSLKHDVTVPISDLPAFVERTGAALEAVMPGVRLVTYGHVGDGNLHYNLSRPPGSDDGAFRARAEELAAIVYDQVAALDGSISAEHGLGQYKNETAAKYKSEVELSLMRGIKNLLDPAGLMNPGKVLPR